MKERLIGYYLDWFNNFLTLSYFAEWHGIEKEDAQILLDMGRKYHEQNVSLKELNDE